MVNIVIIPARGGSKGIPGKNIKPLAGKPLIAYSIEQAIKTLSIDRIIVSTDDQKIKEVALKYGAEVQMRPPELAQDDTPLIPVLQYVVNKIEEEGEQVDIVVLLQPTNPLRKVEHIETAIEKIKAGHNSATTVVPLEIKPVCIMEIDPDGKSIFISEDDRVLRQQIKQYRVDGTVFAYNKETLMQLVDVPWDRENNAPIIIKQKEAIDIDEPFDFKLAEEIIKEAKLKETDKIDVDKIKESGNDEDKIIKSYNTSNNKTNNEILKMPETIQIANKTIGKNQPCFIIAEAGSNHNGSLELAKQLVDKAVESGADAVKFQTFTAEGIVTHQTPKAEYQKKDADPEESYFELLKKLELTKDEFKELQHYCNEKGIIFFSCPHSNKWSVDVLHELDVPVYKVGSGDVTNFPFLEYVASKGKPIIMSVGMATMEEVQEALAVMKKAGNEQIIVLQCTSTYPTPVENVNMNAMKTLKKETGMIVGYSDHTQSLNVPVLAIGMGAEVYEKHYTLDKSMEGPDHAMSMDPQELKEIVKRIREAESALGTAERKPYPGEEEIAKVARKSVVTIKEIKAGETITAEMLDVKRPGTGLHSRNYYQIVGKKATRDLQADQLLQKGDWI